MRSIKCNCLAHFSIKKLYTHLDVVEITFYHWIRIRANGHPTHGACDPWFTSHMSAYDPHVFHKLKDPIRVMVHHEANLCQAQRNLVGIGECG
jgi:hypothetical protein